MVRFQEGYVSVNKKAFDKLASEYNKRSTRNLKHQEEFLSLFEKRLLKEFEYPIRVLDAGCGVGVDSLILSIRGFKVHGVDISEKMLSYARQNSPFTSFEQVDYLGRSNNGVYNGILMDAFIHLFPEKDIPEVLKKTRSLLLPGGLVLVSTNYGVRTGEGYFVKEDYGKKVKRFRKYWTKDEVVGVFEEQGFKLIDYYLDYQKRWGKEWMNFIFQKKNTNP